MESLDIAVILLLPVAYDALPHPVLVRWQLRHGYASPPADLARSAERWNRLVPMLSVILLLLGTVILIRYGGVGTSGLKITYVGFSHALRDGVAAGLGCTAVQVGLMYLAQPSVEHVSRIPLSRWPAALWVPFSMVVAFRRNCGERTPWCDGCRTASQWV